MKDAERELARVLRAARASPRLRGRGAALEVSLKLVGASAMAKLNAKYRGSRYATDVLSFPAPEAIRRAGLALGDLVVCVPTLRRQAREHAHDERTELRVLLVHGVLHLLGFDHERGGKAAREMERWEKRLLGSAGLIRRTRSGSSNV